MEILGQEIFEIRDPKVSHRIITDWTARFHKLGEILMTEPDEEKAERIIRIMIVLSRRLELMIDRYMDDHYEVFNLYE